MKLTALFIVFGLMQVSARSTAQVTIKETAAPLAKVLKAIQRQSNYDLFFDQKLVEGKGKPVAVNLTNVAVEEALKEIFRSQNELSYSISGKIITVKAKEAVTPQLNEGSNPRLEIAPPPTRDITGRITDENGNFLRGAAIKIRGTQKGATTNAEGTFILKGVDEDAVLEISFVGYETMTISVKGRKEFEFALKAKEASLQEVVINKGYYTEKQRFSVGNTVRVDAKEIEKHPVQNVITAIQGLVPGLEITQTSGMNGGGISFRIQGRNSVSNGLDPLIVVDGVPFPSQMVAQLAGSDLDILKGGSPLNYLNPSDIESVEILKDADATALYGSRAANGAILITTKRGKAGKTRITVSWQQGWSKKTQNAEVLNTQQYLEMRKEGIRNDNRIASSNPLAAAPFIYAPDLTIWDTTRYTDWQKELTGGAAQYTKANATISGGNSNLQFLIGGTYDRRTTIFPGSYSDQNGTAHFSISGASSDQRFKATLTGSYLFGSNTLPGIDYTQIAIQQEPNAPALYNADGSINWAPDASGTSTWVNPVAKLFGNDFIVATKSLVSSLSVIYKLSRNLNFYTNLGYTNLDNINTALFRLDAYSPENRPARERVTLLRYSNSNGWNIEPQLVYHSVFGKGKIDALVGTTIQQSNYSYLGMRGAGFSSDVLMKTMLAAQTVSIQANTSGVSRYNSLFARVNYNYDGKYLFNMNFRRDGSNKFGDNSWYGDFWSGGAGWIFSEESWAKKAAPWLSFGKLRLTYGVTGNDQIADFSYLSIYTLYNPGVQYQGVVNWLPTNIANPYLQWERTKKLQGGIDLSFFTERVNLSAGYALNRSDNQLTSYPLSYTSGFNTITVNRPTVIQNTSVELSLTTVNIKTKDFSWVTRFNITIPRNKLVSFPGIENTSYANGANGLIVGEPLGILKVGRYLGINPVTGRALYADVNGNPTTARYNATDPRFSSVLISTNAIYYGGLASGIRFKEFQIDLSFYYKRGIGPRLLEWSNGTNNPGTLSVGAGATGSGNQPVSVYNRWQRPGDGNVHNPAYSTSTNYADEINSTNAYYSLDASFVRLKNISLSWQVPRSFLKKAKFENMFVSLLGENLATFSKYSGLDPESGTGMPPLRTITLQVKVDF